MENRKKPTRQQAGMTERARIGLWTFLWAIASLGGGPGEPGGVRAAALTRPTTPKRRPRGAKTAQEAAKTAQDAAKTAQETLKTIQERSKRAPRRPKSDRRDPQTTQDGLKTAQEGSKTAQEAFQGSPQGAREAKILKKLMVFL